MGLVLLMAPVLALVPAMVVDRGWDGTARVSAFPAALVILDPLVWRCVRNSAAVALVVTVGSLVVGTGLGMILGRRRFWGRGSLGLLAVVPVAVSPIWVAPGVVAWIGGESGWTWLAARSFLGQPGDDWARWVALVWVGLAGTTPLVILATLEGLRRVNPAWADAARVVGAGRRRVWLDVTWPTLRPGLGRVGGAIFAWILIEPAGPTILGLRRTLVVELTDAAFRSDEANRAATLAAIAVVIAVATRSLFARWGGASSGVLSTRFDSSVAPRAGFRLGGFAVAVLAGWGFFALGPVISLGRRLGAAAMGGHPPGWGMVRLILDQATTSEVQGWAINSGLSASLAIGLDLALLALLMSGTRGVSRCLAAVPPLAMAVGALAIPALLATWADATARPDLAAILRVLRTELSPGRSPGLLLVLVLAATRLPGLVQTWAATDHPTQREQADAALLAGASTRRASQLARGGHGLPTLRPTLIAWTWASTDLAAAWVLTTLDERRTFAPAALDLIGSGAGTLDPRLLGLFVAMTTLRLMGLILLVGRGRRSGWSLAV